MSKLLGEFLQEQQEPFALEVFLVQRGYRRGRYHNARRYPNCADFVKAVLTQLVLPKTDEKLKRGRGDAFTEKLKRRQDCSSEDSSTTLSTLMKLGNPFLQEKVEAERESKWIADEDSKRLSPISVLSPIAWCTGNRVEVSGKQLIEVLQKERSHEIHSKREQIQNPMS